MPIYLLILPGNRGTGRGSRGDAGRGAGGGAGRDPYQVSIWFNLL